VIIEVQQSDQILENNVISITALISRQQLIPNPLGTATDQISPRLSSGQVAQSARYYDPERKCGRCLATGDRELYQTGGKTFFRN
jgi:hypothetical protein